MNKDTKGAIAEAKVIASLLASGRIVLTPFGGKQSYDLAVDNLDGTITKIQVKSGWRNIRKQGVVLFKTTSYSGGVHRTSKSYAGLIDYFAVYDDIEDKIYFIPIAAVSGKGDVHLRLDETTINNGKMRYASQYPNTLP